MNFSMSEAWREATAMISANREVLLIVSGIFFFIPSLAVNWSIGDLQEVMLAVPHAYASLNLHGVTGTITTKVSVQKLSANRVLVQSLSPILIKAGDYALTDGVEALRAAVGIASISVAVPVDFALVFDAR